MTKDKSLIILPKWSTVTREVQKIMQGWPNAKMSGNNKILPTAYPVTLCWKPHKDQTPSEISFDSTAYERYADQLGPPPGSPTPDPAPASDAVEPATALHKRGVSDVTTRSEREAEHEQERPAQRAVGVQERPARRAVGTQELVGLGIEGAQEGGEGTQGRPRRVRVPSKTAPGDVRESWV